MDKAFEIFKRNLKKSQRQILAVMLKVEDLLLSEDINKKINEARVLGNLCNELIGFCYNDTPAWVRQLKEHTDAFITKKNVESKKKLIKILVDLRNEVALHDWTKGGYNNDLNFEEIYKKYKAESKLPELFDELIEIIEKILGEESIELGDAEKKLKLLLTVIRSNLNKSFFADKSILSYLLYFWKEFLFNLTERIPGLKEFLDAIIATAKKINEELEATTVKTQNQIKKTLSVSMDQLLIYDPKGNLHEIEKEFDQKIDLLK